MDWCLDYDTWDGLERTQAPNALTICGTSFEQAGWHFSIEWFVRGW